MNKNLTMSVPTTQVAVAGTSNQSDSRNSNRDSSVKTEKRARLASTEDNGEYDEWAKRLVSRPIPQMVTGTPQLLSSNSVNQFLLQSGTGSANGTSQVTIGTDGLPPHKG